ncbi:hypothetical protein IFM89_009834 [Coptis chinensis]|uniref:GrpE protein homolog n=1 Tax=Coptis chinensis TaxID=261450 RepID=A0A835LUA4_9MAGN|nr:hypothetical protein IFM89_009834 [Coptis chinensis]
MPCWFILSQVDEKKLKGSDLKKLIDAYKEAILNGDEKTVLDKEAFFRKLEDEKNELAEKVGALLPDIASQKENFIRTQADFENFRKQFEKDQLRLTFNTQKDVIESLLPVVDNFEKAKQHIIPETEKGQKINTSYQSIYKQFVEILRSLRVSAVQTIGKPFDPLLHEAIAREESQQFKEGVIIQETRRGFLLGGRVLRPAVVKVSTGSGHKKTLIPTEESEGQPATAAVDGDSMSNG